MSRGKTVHVGEHPPRAGQREEAPLTAPFYLQMAFAVASPLPKEIAWLLLCTSECHYSPVLYSQEQTQSSQIISSRRSIHVSLPAGLATLSGLTKRRGECGS